APRLALRGLVVAGFAGGVWLLTGSAAHAADAPPPPAAGCPAGSVTGVGTGVGTGVWTDPASGTVEVARLVTELGAVATGPLGGAASGLLGGVLPDASTPACPAGGRDGRTDATPSGGRHGRMDAAATPGRPGAAD